MAIKALNSVAGFSVGEVPANIILANGDITASNAIFSGNLLISNSNANWGVLTDNLYYSNGSPWDLQQAAGSNSQVQFNNNQNFGASANFTFDTATNLLTLTGNIDVTNIVRANYLYANANVLANNVNANSNINVTGTLLANFISANANIVGNNISVNANTITNNLTVNLELAGNTANFTGNITTLNANLGNLVKANYVNVASNVTTSNLTVNLELSGNTANFTGNITTLNANLGNLASANYVNVAANTITNALTVNNNIAGNTANFSGNITSLNANLGNLASANYVNVANDLNVLGNITGANLVGSLANGNSNVKVYSNANVEITINGSSNVATFTETGLLVLGNINSTTGHITANGNVIANGFVNAANANVSGEALIGSVKTATIVAPTGNITISAAGTNENIILAPTGTGAISVSGKKIIQLADPVNPTDAATKEYVDAMAGEGLDIHIPVRVESPTALTATYAQGGTTPTVDSITGNAIIDFGSAHGLSVNDGIVFTNSFNGLVGGEAYWVYSVPSSTSITVKDGYFGPEVTTLTNGTSLAKASRANPGVGATLTNAGANAALTIDGITLSTSDRVLVYTQTNAYENGVYTVTTVGNGSTAWVLTRATDFNKYSPDSPNGLSTGSYVFVTQGVTGAGESYVMTAPVGEVIIGTDNLTFTQFSAAGSYSAGSGINITGTSISANVDGVTTDIVSGNIVVKTSANLTTPNIGDATFSSLSWNTLSNGNVTANNLSIGNIANITGNLRVDGIIQSAGNITSNANVNSNNTSVTNLLTVGGNILANNIVSNNEFSTNTANISSNLVTSNLTVNLALNGNTANFSSSLAAGQTTISGNLLISNSTANWGVLTDKLYYSNGQPWDLQEAAGSNNQIQFNSNDNFAADANLTFNPATGVFGVVGTANISDAVIIGNTSTKWGTLTTTTVSANQTIASVPVTGITGIQFLVKGIDSSGSKYSVATVQAVTNGVDSVDYATYGTVNLGGYTGALAVNVQGGFLRLQVTPASGNSTVWTTQYRII